MSLDDIQAVSLARNSELGVTGLLIATADYFGQLLQGPERAIDDLMDRIGSDDRHSEIAVVRRETIERPSHARWSMARFDGEYFNGAEISPLLARLHDRRRGEPVRRVLRLIDMIASCQAARGG